MKTYETPEWIAEQSYKNGYAKGYEDGKRDAVKHGRWIETEEGTICSECNKHPFEDGEFAIANYNGNYCPNCGTMMDLPHITEQAQAAIDAIGRKAHGED